MQQKQDKVITNFFCKKGGHVKKDCPKYAKWLVKNGKLLYFFCFEVNLALIPNHTWWIDIGVTTHTSVTMQGCLRSRVPIDAERFIYMENGNKAHVEAVGLFRLQLEFGCYLYLDETFYVPSFRWNWVFVYHLDKSGHSYSFGNGKMSLFQYSNMIGIGSLVDNLYKLDINVTHINESLHASNCGRKHKLTYENSSMLWHKNLEHISKQSI